MKIFRNLLLVLFLICSSYAKVAANHLFGGELYYTHISGNTYKVTMVLYGDCASTTTTTAFSALYTAKPGINIYNGTSLYSTMNLDVESGAGEEVTPVCPDSLGATSCNGGTVPGVRRFSYSKIITLPSVSTNWRFESTGDLAGSTAGRSATITNIISSGSSVMSLVATLNNLTQPNSNPIYTTIPTPFFCINVPQEYNQGAVDPNTGDSLTYELVPGVVAGGSTVTYIGSYTASEPLACSSGTFSFSKSSGQLTFTPNLAQKSLVVGKVSEYRGGVLVGTSMREMTFIVLSTCSNRSPYGKISSVSGGVATGNTVVDICEKTSLLKFNINPVDSDANEITVSVQGLPSGATLDITGSGTLTPKTAFSWNTSAVPAGSYYFFVTYQDFGCPLSSKQTVAYTINVISKPLAIGRVITPATCVKKEVLDIYPVNGTAPWTINVFSGVTTLHTLTGTSSAIRDSLSPGTYKFGITNSIGCYGEVNYTVKPPPVPSFKTITVKPILCFGDTGSVFVEGVDSLAPYTYSIDGGAFSSSGTFTGLLSGTHIIRLMDKNFCTKDTAFKLSDPAILTLSSATDRPLCNPYNDGSIDVKAGGGTAPYLYAFGASGAFGPGSYFGSLASDTYIIRVKDSNNCIKSFSVLVEDSITVQAGAALKHIRCSGGTEGSITLTPYIGKGPFLFALDGSAYGPSPEFTGLGAGTYIASVKDANGCIMDTVLKIIQPFSLAMTFEPKMPLCNGSSDGVIRIIGSGGGGFYTYSINGGAFKDSTIFKGLSAGDYKIRVKDLSGCVMDSVITLSQPDPIHVSTIITHPLCNRSADGAVSISARGGTSPYLYSFNSSTPGVVTDFSGLKAGTYAIKITDTNGCVKDTGIIFIDPSKISFDKIDITHPTCEDYPDGKILLTMMGGIPPYKYSVDGNAFSANNPIEGLKEGAYTVYVRDSNNCETNILLSLVGYPKIKLDSTKIVPPNCFGAKDGSFQLFASGGNFPLRYTLNEQVDTLKFAAYRNLKSGDYIVTVTDTTHCYKNFVVSVIEPSKLALGTEIIHNDCTGADNSRITVLVAGGTRPYQYIWSVENQNDSVANGLANGFYTVRVNDAHNCTDTILSEIHYDNCCTPSIPSAFTPNGDGKNDVLHILYQGGVVLKEFSIYNRYGQQVYSSDNINQGWDGKFKGQEMGLGVYYYYIRMVCGNSKNRDVSFKGDITLIR